MLLGSRGVFISLRSEVIFLDAIALLRSGAIIPGAIALLGPGTITPGAITLLGLITPGAIVLFGPGTITLGSGASAAVLLSHVPSRVGREPRESRREEGKDVARALLSWG